MARFIDQHTLPPMAAEQQKTFLAQIRAGIEAKKADEFGVTTLNVFVGPGKVFGYQDAPNAEAIVKSHAALAVKIDLKDITPVNPLV